MLWPLSVSVNRVEDVAVSNPVVLSPLGEQRSPGRRVACHLGAASDSQIRVHGWQFLVGVCRVEHTAHNNVLLIISCVKIDVDSPRLPRLCASI